MDKKAIFQQAEQLRHTANAAYQRATDALMHGDRSTFHQENGRAHRLGNEAAGLYSQAGVSLDHGGKPFGPHVKRLMES